MTTTAVNTTPNVASVNASGNAASPAPGKAEDPFTSKNTFLQLLVAQLRNQDPLSPADGLQFVTQLAQFSGLEQSIEIRDELRKIREVLTAQQNRPTPAGTGAGPNP